MKTAKQIRAYMAENTPNLMAEHDKQIGIIEYEIGVRVEEIIKDATARNIHVTSGSINLKFNLLESVIIGLESHGFVCTSIAHGRSDKDAVKYTVSW
jgi:hypothetical protein